MDNTEVPTRMAVSDVPPAVYIAPERIMAVMAAEGGERLRHLNPLRVFALAVLAGGFITVGALFSVLLATGSTNEGVIRLLEGLGFSAGFFFVILSHAVLFTEANVVMPATVIHGSERRWTILRFWGLAWIGNFVGAFIVANMIGYAQEYSPEVQALIREIIAAKMSFRDVGGVQGWTMIIVSGVLANWLVGMAAFFAMMGRTIFGKYIPVFLAVTAFVAANFQHSPANMGFFSLAAAQGDGPGWTAAILWNILPAGIGNIIGGSLLVAALMSYAFRTRDSFA
jgi:formate transporter